jgi:UDP-3-O-[3-hydroxymyristoyl] glucosamine N-acyltransferase
LSSARVDVTPVSLATLVAELGGELSGASELLITGLAPLESATGSEISFLSNPKYQRQLAASQAGCVIVSPVMAAVAAARGAFIVTPDPYLYFARLTQLWRTLRNANAPAMPRVHPSAVVDPSATIAAAARIGPLCVVEAGAMVGEGSVLTSRVTLGADCHIGARCLVHSGVVIGADGFGFAPDGERWEKIEQLGAVRIGNDVEIGANTCIDRGALQDTVIEDGVKLDNLIQIGHNVRVGANTAMAGCVGVAGSATIGPNCTVGGGAIILGHLTLAAGVHISAATVVSKSITKPGHYTGMFPIDENANWERNAASLKQLHSLRDRIKTLEKENKP